MRSSSLLLLCLVLLPFSACSLLPQKRSEDASVKASEKLGSQNGVVVHRVVDGEKTPPTPNVSVSGTSNKVDVTVNAAASGPRVMAGTTATQAVPIFHEETTVNSTSEQTAVSAETAKSRFSISLPLGVSLLIGAIGLTAAVFAIRYALKSAKNSSLAVAKGMDFADQALAGVIDRAQAKAAAAVDPAVALHYQSDVAALEKQRGKLANL